MVLRLGVRRADADQHRRDHQPGAVRASTSGTTTSVSSRAADAQPRPSAECARGLTKRKIPNATSDAAGAHVQHRGRRPAGRGRARARRRARSTPRGRSRSAAARAAPRAGRRSCSPRRDREQPAHRRVEAVVGPEQRDQDQGQAPSTVTALSPGSSRSRTRRRRPAGAPGAGARRGTRRRSPGRASASRPRRRRA